VELESLAKQTTGFSGADLANLVNEAAILAARNDRRTIRMIDLREAIDRVIAGPESKTRVMSEWEKSLTAYHEAGHAVVGRFIEHHDPVHKITIVPRGMAGGYTRFLPAEDRHYMVRTQFQALVASALGGYAAEQVVFGQMSTGANNDIRKATDIARRMVTEYGMTERLGPIALIPAEHGQSARNSQGFSESLAAEIDEEVRRLISTGYETATALVQQHRDVLERVALELIRVEVLEGEELERVFRGEPAIEPLWERGPELPTPAAPVSPERATSPAPNATHVPRLAPGLASQSLQQRQPG
jgi:cell division protease FtsH